MTAEAEYTWDGGYLKIRRAARKKGVTPEEKAAYQAIMANRGLTGKEGRKQARAILKNRTKRGAAIGAGDKQMKAGRDADGNSVGLKQGFKPKKAGKPASDTD